MNEQHSTRTNRIYEQRNDELNADESFEQLQRLIEDNSAGGGDFTIYIDAKSANQGLSAFFRVENSAVAVSRPGIGNLPAMGYVPAEEVERRLAQERKQWDLERRIEELESEQAGKVNFGQAAIGQIIEDGTLSRVVESLTPAVGAFLMGLLGKVIPSVQPAQVVMAGFPTDAPADVAEGTDQYNAERIAAFLNKIRPHFNTHEEMYAFLDKVSDFFVKNPGMSKSMFQ
jgi:hypothetical protein